MRYAKRRHYVWTSNMAYLVGLMASDGCLSGDGRHLDLTSVDIEQLENFNTALGRDVRISEKKNQHQRTAYRVQFSDVALYDFLCEVGLTPNKSKTLGALEVPNVYYVDFLRGLFDGDGSCNAYWDKRWKSSYMYYTNFASASKSFLEFIANKNSNLIHMGRGSLQPGVRGFNLSYAKADSKKLYHYMYYKSDSLRLSRKFRKLQNFIEEDKNAKMTE